MRSQRRLGWLFGVCLLVLPSCSEDPLAGLAGAYRVTVDPTVFADPAEQLTLSNLRPTQALLRADGTYEMKLPIARSVFAGRWSCTDDGVTLELLDEDGATSQLHGTVVQRRITLRNEGEELTRRFFLDPVGN